MPELDLGTKRQRMVFTHIQLLAIDLANKIAAVINNQWFMKMPVKLHLIMSIPHRMGRKNPFL
ncbi:hypothetical [Yersinia pestis KIM10+]|uniref:Uncharacterized protein n=1 Tax=Yersinia pestis TaxID=632 RepID=Q8CLD3_YERPE|nr:hypothetical [Yersinia pestis KIM10+]